MMAIPVELQPDVLMAGFEQTHGLAGKLAKYFPFMAMPGAGVTVSYDVLEYQNRLMPWVPRGGPAPAKSGATRTSVTLEGITLKAMLPLSAEELKDMRDVGTRARAQRENAVARAVRQLRLDMERTWEFLRAQWLTGGALVDSSNAVPGAADGTVYLRPDAHAIDSPLSVSLGLSATHINATVAASWATAATDIKANLDTARSLIAADTGIDANRVVLNRTTMGYIDHNNDAMASDYAKNELARQGTLRTLWDYEFDVMDDAFPISTDLFNDTAGTQKLIPDGVVIVTTADNNVAGRAMLECEAVDAKAPSGQKGVFFWTDEQGEHPHAPRPGVEWSGAPMIQNTDSLYIFTDVTAT